MGIIIAVIAIFAMSVLVPRIPPIQGKPAEFDRWYVTVKRPGQADEVIEKSSAYGKRP